MGRKPDKHKGLMEDIRAAQSEITSAAHRIARLTSDPAIIDAVLRITQAAQRTVGYAEALRELRNIELDVRAKLGLPLGTEEI